MKKILVVEDETILRDAYKKILHFEGFEVYEAADGAEALKQLKTAKPDLILLDILMPKVNGMKFLERAKMSQKYPHTTIIAFSNLSDPETIQKIMQLGAHHHILKASLSPQQLVATVRAFLD